MYVIGPGGAYAVINEERDTRFFIDSAPETYRITLFVTRRFSEQRQRPRYFSADEGLAS